MPEPQQKPQSDPWAEAAKNFKPQADGGTAPAPSGNDDWKVWQQNSGGGDSTDTRNFMQKSFDDNTKTSPNEPLLETGLKSVVGAVGRPFVHPQQTFSGMAKGAHEHPIRMALEGPAGAAAEGLYNGAKGLWDSAKSDYHEAGGGKHGVAYAGTKMAGDTFGNAALGAAAGAAPGAAEGVGDMIPTRAKAGDLFNNVMSAAKDQPVNFTRSMPHLERTQQLASAGATPLRPADLLYQRVNTVNPVPYGEARDFASNLSRMSAAERMATNPQMAREARMLSHSLNDDVGEAADQAGVGDDYRKAMGMYSRAARNSEMAKTAGKMALKAGKYALPAGAGYEAIKHFSQ